MAAITMKPSASSMITEHGYDPETQTAALRFANGKLYHYDKVPPEEYLRLADAKSIGQHFGKEFRPVFTGRLVDETPPEEDATA